MKNRSLIDDHVKRGSMRLKALETLFAQGAFADVVGESQEVVELVGKALIRFLGAEPARVHDVGAQLTELRDRVGKKLQPGLDDLIAVSRELRRDRELAFYGTEDLTPSEFYSKRDAEQAMGFAKRSVKFVKEMVAA